MGNEQDSRANPLWAFVIVRGVLASGVLGLLAGGVIMAREVESPWGWGGVFLGVTFGCVMGLFVGLISSVMGVVGHAMGMRKSERAGLWASSLGASIGATAVFAVMLRGNLFTASAGTAWAAIVLAGLLGPVLARPLGTRVPHV